MGFLFDDLSLTCRFQEKKYHFVFLFGSRLKQISRRLRQEKETMSLLTTRAWFKDELKSVLRIALLEIPFPCILHKSKGSKIKHIFLIILTLFPWALTSRYKHSKKCNAFIHTPVGMCGSWKPTASSGHLIKGISTFPLGVFTFSTSLSIRNIILVSSVEKLLGDKGLLSARGNEDGSFQK